MSATSSTGQRCGRVLPPVSLQLCVCALTALDQVTKHAVWRTFRLGESRPVIDGFFSLTYVRNIGAAWGIMSGFGLLLISLAIMALGVITTSRRKLFGETFSGRTVYVLMCSGILGNLLDRIRLGYVVDYLDFFWGQYHFPAFNVADISICLGVALYVIIGFLSQKTSDEAGG